jgi:phospholipase/carboxylesterase
MSLSPVSWHGTQLAEGYYTSELPSCHSLPVRTFLPTGYEPNYPYPLVVFFHEDGSSEEQILRLAPKISRRNYICISLRGPLSTGVRNDGTPAYSWGVDGEFDTLAEEYMLRAVEHTRRTYHVHSERIYLAGICEGANIAYRLAFKMPEKLGGVVCLNGTLPRPINGQPLFRLPDVRSLRVFIGHGNDNRNVPLDQARRDFRMLYTAGLDVSFSRYPTDETLHPLMLRDVNRFILGNVESEFGINEETE